MKKLLAALPLVAALTAAPAFAGTLGAVATEPPVVQPPVVVPGGLAFNPLYLIPVVLIACAVACDSDDSTGGTGVMTSE